MVETIPAEAKACFTRYVPDYGIVHGDPNGTDEARRIFVPVDYVETWVGEGLIVAPKSSKPAKVSAEKEAEVASSAPASDTAP